MNQATLGTPCLVPVQVDAPQGECRGFITRLALGSAAVSSDPPLKIGDSVTLRFTAPASGTSVSVPGVVREQLGEGGLWRGRPAALVILDEPLGAEVLGSSAGSSHPNRRGSEASPQSNPAIASLTGTAAGMGGALRTTGLGRRRHTASYQRPAEPDPEHDADSVSGDSIDAPSSPLMRQLSSEVDLPARLDSDDHTAPPAGSWLTDPEASAVADPYAALSRDDIPPIQATDPQLPAVFGRDPDDLSPGGDGDEDFFGLFGRVSEVPEYALPPGAEDSMALGAQSGRLSAVEDEDDAGTEKPKTTASGYFAVEDSGRPAPRRPEDLGPQRGRPDDTFGEMLESGLQDRAAISEAPPVRNTLSLGDAPLANLPPWEEDLPGQSLIPRNARIASSLDVTFWARGRSHKGTAQNFSKEGLYIGYPKDPPVRGAIVRIEFPVQGDGEPVPIRFNAEVRWQSADRQGHDLPDGFGVQILTFESPKDRLRYDQLLLMILSLHQTQSKREQSGFSWGKPGGAG